MTRQLLDTHYWDDEKKLWRDPMHHCGQSEYAKGCLESEDCAAFSPEDMSRCWEDHRMFFEKIGVLMGKPKQPPSPPPISKPRSEYHPEETFTVSFGPFEPIDLIYSKTVDAIHYCEKRGCQLQTWWPLIWGARPRALDAVRRAARDCGVEGFA